MSREIGDWMLTYTGKRFWPLDPDPEDVDIIDIGHALGMLCRYNGHCQRFYSVAEHSVLLSQHLEKHSRDAALWALMHDSAEAYISDLIRPVKFFIKDFHVLEERILGVIAQHFNLPAQIPDVVHQADDTFINDEGKQLFDKAPWVAPNSPTLGIQLKLLYPVDAKYDYLKQYTRLTGVLIT